MVGEHPVSLFVQTGPPDQLLWHAERKLLPWNQLGAGPVVVADRSGSVSLTEQEPPEGAVYDLNEALDLLATLAVLSPAEHQIQILSHRLGSDQGGLDVH
jgi:hypothetical protein